MALVRRPDTHAHLTHTNVRVVGQTIVSPSPVVLPEHICVKCGQTHLSGKFYEKKLFWTPTWAVLLILISPLIYIIVAMIARKKVDIAYHRCDDCTANAQKMAIGAVLTWLATFGLIPLAISLDMAALLCVTPLLLIAATALTVKASPPLKAKGHDKGIFMLSGAHPIFLQQIDTDIVDTFS